MKSDGIKRHRKLAGVAVPALASCGGYYTADIAGYVKDDETGAGVNGAIIRVYSEEPETADAEGFTVETASMTSGGNAGYYSHKIIWRNWLPAFGDEGDSGSVWLAITHDDYVPAITVARELSRKPSTSFQTYI